MYEEVGRPDARGGNAAMGLGFAREGRKILSVYITLGVAHRTIKNACP